jgi:uncharacterized membrane protein YphA (DoxX/SURF4 family)
MSTSNSNSRQAYQILKFAFTVAPILAGLDKFTNFLTNWSQYLSPLVSKIIPASTFMPIVGVIEIVAGILVAVKPRIAAYVVSAWLFLIIINLLTIPGYFDVALRDLGLCLGALALGRLSEDFAS